MLSGQEVKSERNFATTSPIPSNTIIDTQIGLTFVFRPTAADTILTKLTIAWTLNLCRKSSGKID